MLFRRKKTDTPNTLNIGDVIDIQWGGYYTSLENGKYNVFRLLDFNKDAYHVQMFQEKFDRSPSFAEVKDLKPFLWHTPIAVGGLLNLSKFKLIGHKKLDEQSLMGYIEYLKQVGDEAATKEIVNKLIDFSDKAPMKVQLTKSAEGVTVTPLK